MSRSCESDVGEPTVPALLLRLPSGLWIRGRGLASLEPSVIALPSWRLWRRLRTPSRVLKFSSRARSWYRRWPSDGKNKFPVIGDRAGVGSCSFSGIDMEAPPLVCGSRTPFIVLRRGLWEEHVVMRVSSWCCKLGLHLTNAEFAVCFRSKHQNANTREDTS